MDKPQPQDTQEPTPNATTVAPVESIAQLLKAKDDTSRFVGLALLKSTLDTDDGLRNDQAVISRLWSSVSSKFLDRLLRTGSKSGAKQADAREMLDLAAHVIYTFAVLLPDDEKSDGKLLARVPLLVDGLLQSSEETTDVILRALLTIASSSHDGSTAFLEILDWSSLTEISPKQPMALTVLAWAWTNGSAPGDASALATRIDQAIAALCASYKGTDAVTLLDFLGKLLSRIDPNFLLKQPTWLEPIVTFIHSLVLSKPTAASREAYTNCAANLLVAYGDTASDMLFKGVFNTSKAVPHLFMNLILIDIRACLPTLLEKLNTSDYPATSERLTSGLVVISFFINHLLHMMERADSEDIFSEVQPDLLLKLRDSVVETLSLVMEYLRDRWDAAVSGAQGLHPEARAGVAHTASGSLKTLAWDSQHETASEDRLLLAALKCLGDWLREDDGPTLRGEATGLMDLLVDLYQPSSAARVGVATRPLVLGVLDGILKEEDGVQALLEHDGWSILSKDLLNILTTSEESDQLGHELGQHISAILVIIVESRTATPEDWLDVVTATAAYNVPPSVQPRLSLQQLWADVLEVCTALFTRAPPGIKRRYVHSASALSGIARSISEKDLDQSVSSQISEFLQLLQRDPVLNGLQ
ncbi:DUF1941 family protein [Truncatella angustata]|uniref:DUF1941 family protein n=1 Tax=Truncatella angustata TaxID=152316 RepID=A0A9P8ZXE5_9PEZI|nr:DUF1941 family protein [Truncatella angustata]KAH6654752.1 DUF1941 family protein [Truncatella angustata]